MKIWAAWWKLQDYPANGVRGTTPCPACLRLAYTLLPVCPPLFIMSLAGKEQGWMEPLQCTQPHRCEPRWCRNTGCLWGWHTSPLSLTSPSHLRVRSRAAQANHGTSHAGLFKKATCLGVGTGQPPKVPTSHPRLSFFTPWGLRQQKKTMSYQQFAWEMWQPQESNSFKSLNQHKLILNPSIQPQKSHQGKRHSTISSKTLEPGST